MRYPERHMTKSQGMRADDTDLDHRVYPNYTGKHQGGGDGEQHIFTSHAVEPRKKQGDQQGRHYNHQRRENCGLDSEKRLDLVRFWS